MKKLLSFLLAMTLVLGACSALADAALPDMVLDAVMDALGGGCRETYEARRAGGPVGMSARGDAARGVQQTLVDFGQDIAADGIVGAKTLTALNAVQAAFGLEATEALDAGGYAALLPRLLALRDPDAAEALLADSLGGEYFYMRGCANQLDGRFYTARRDFIESQWGDWQARAEACEQPWPGNGQIYKDSAVKGGAVQLTVQVNDETEATLVKIYMEDGALAAALFIGGAGSATTFLPGGSYTIRDGRGKTWFGLAEAFGDGGTYETLTFEDGAQAVSLEAGRGYAVTINAAAVNEGARTVGAAQMGWQGF